MRPLSEIRSCLEVTDSDIQSALAPARTLSDRGPRSKVLELISHMASVAAPGRGAPKILLVMAQMATRDWLEGELFVKLIGDDDLSVLELFVDGGFSRERILGPVMLDVPLDEFRSALELHPERAHPLVVLTSDPRRLELESTTELGESAPAPAFSAVSESLLPLMGDHTRAMPQLATLITDGDEDDSPDALPEVMITEGEDDLDALLRPNFKPLSLPPHLKDALQQIKKK